MRPGHRLRADVSGEAPRFRARLGEARAVQERRLATILQRHAATEYGRRRRFAAIRNAAEFADSVPVVDYEALREPIERMANGEAGVLVADRVVAFEETGGSGGGAKLVPYTEAALEGFRRGLLPWLDDLYSSVPTLADGTAYWSISPAGRPARITRGGLPVGLSDADYFGTSIAPSILDALSVPPRAGAIADLDAWRRFTLVHLLSDDRLGLVSVWSPTFLLQLLRHAREEAPALARAIATGTLCDDAPANGVPLPAPRPDPSRADRVAAALADDPTDWAALWPDLAVVSCWDQAGARPYADELRRMLPGVSIQGKGLLATEGLVTVPLFGHPWPVLAVDSGYFEFVAAEGRVHGIADVVPDTEYGLVVTNDSGFYRYAIGDRVRVRGFVGEAPTLEFVGRDGMSIDLCGEKLTDGFVAAALAPLSLRFATLAPRTAPTPGYVLVVDAAEVPADAAEALAARADGQLASNPQYGYARRLGQLAPLECVRCVDAIDRWLERGIALGQRLGDVKPAALAPDLDWATREPRRP